MRFSPSPAASSFPTENNWQRMAVATLVCVWDCLCISKQIFMRFWKKSWSGIIVAGDTERHWKHQQAFLTKPKKFLKCETQCERGGKKKKREEKKKKTPLTSPKPKLYSCEAKGALWRQTVKSTPCNGEFLQSENTQVRNFFLFSWPGKIVFDILEGIRKKNFESEWTSLTAFSPSLPLGKRIFSDRMLSCLKMLFPAIHYFSGNFLSHFWRLISLIY